MSDIIKCTKCGHVLMAGSGAIFLGPGTSIECRKCGNKYIFGQKPNQIEQKAEEKKDER